MSSPGSCWMFAGRTISRRSGDSLTRTATWNARYPVAVTVSRSRPGDTPDSSKRPRESLRALTPLPDTRTSTSAPGPPLDAPRIAPWIAAGVSCWAAIGAAIIRSAVVRIAIDVCTTGLRTDVEDDVRTDGIRPSAHTETASRLPRIDAVADTQLERPCRARHLDEQGPTGDVADANA